MKTENLDPTKITQTPDCQPRAVMVDSVVNGLVDLLDGGDVFQDRVVVFKDSDGVLRLTDGFHRLKAHLVWCEKRGSIVDIAADVHDGDEQAAVAFAVKANSAHGKRRNSDDLRRAFDIAARREIITDRRDSRDVQAKLGCSLRMAERLTEPYRKVSRKQRDNTAREMAEDGHTQTEIAEVTGVDQGTISRNMQSRQLAELHNCVGGAAGERDSGAEFAAPNGGRVDGRARSARSEAIQNSSLEKRNRADLSADAAPAGHRDPFDKLEALIRDLYKGIADGVPVSPAVRDMVGRCKSCLEAARGGDEVPQALLTLLGEFIRHSKRHVR